MAIAALALLLSQPALAEPPDYVSFMQRAERFAVAATSGGSCARLGYLTDESGMKLKLQKLIDDAELSGMPGGNADMLISGAISSESARQAARSEEVKTDPTNKAAIEQFLAYWEARCASLAADPDYGQYFRR